MAIRVVVMRALSGGRYLGVISPQPHLQVFEDWTELARLEAAGATIEWESVPRPEGYQVAMMNLRHRHD
jgi:hypothetical protein